MTGLNRLDGEWLTQVQLGDDPRFFTEWFQPLSLTNDVFLAPALRHEIRSFNLVEDGSTLARYRVRESVASIAIGAEVSHWGEVRLGLRRGDGAARVRIGDPALVDQEFDIGGTVLGLGYDGLDSAYFPTHGQSAGHPLAGGPRGARRESRCRPPRSVLAGRLESRPLQPAARSRGRLRARRRIELAAGPVHARRIPRAVRSAAGCADRNAVRPRARGRVPARQPRRHGPVRVSRVPRVLGRGGQRLGRPGTMSIWTSSSSAAASSSVRRARSARSILRRASPSTASVRCTCCWAGRSEPGDSPRIARNGTVPLRGTVPKLKCGQSP